jgi:outer membrane protein assembly factor BamB
MGQHGSWRSSRARNAVLCVCLSLAGQGPLLPLDPERPDPENLTPHDPPRIVVGRPVNGYDWLQFNLDSQRTGQNNLEWRISRGNVSSLKTLFRVPMIDLADGAPVYLGGVSTPSGTRDLIFATTTASFVVAHDACTGSRLWFRPPTTGPLWTTSLPAVDPNRQFVYSYQLDGFVHKFLVGDGTEVTVGGWPELATRKPDVEKGSSNLSIVVARDARRFLYVTHAGYPGPGPGDQGDYQGHVTAIDLDNGTQTVFNTLCSDRAIHFDESLVAPNDCPKVRAAVWGRPGVTYDPVTDRILFTTGNGDFDGNLGGRDWGDSVLALPPDLTTAGGLPADSYTPTEFQQLDDNDEDLGSSSPLILPDPIHGGPSRIAVQTGKDGQVRLLDVADLSSQGGPGHVGGERTIVPLPQGGEVLTAPAAWVDPVDQSVWIFIANDQGISGLRLVGGALQEERSRRLAPRERRAVVPTVGWKQNRGGTSPIVANGVLYYAGTGFIAALDPRTGKELWSDHEVGEIHWQSPILVNGVLYLTDNTPALAAYALNGVVKARSDGPCH